MISAHAATPTSLVRPFAGAEVNWSDGTITASAGAAADLRMPSPDAARPGAERRARATAVAKLRAALRALSLRGNERPGEKQVDAALVRARTTRIEYQSNGGVVLWLQVRFEDLVENVSTTPSGGSATDNLPQPPARASHAPVAATQSAELAVGAMPLELAPLLVGGGKEIIAGHVRYQHGPPPAGAIVVRRDDRGRLVLPTESEATLAALASGPVVIYLQRVLP